MRFIYATYNMLHNCIDVTTFDGYILRIDCGKAEEGLKTTPYPECALIAFPQSIRKTYPSKLISSIQLWSILYAT